MNIKIPGYTLHGDYYLADDVINYTNGEQACVITQAIDLPNGKKVIARTLSKKELETIPRKERQIGTKWYWTCSHKYDDNYPWYVDNDGNFYYDYIITTRSPYGGTRLGFKNPFLHSDKKEAGSVYKDREFQKNNNKNTIKEEILEIYNKCFNY